MRACDREVQRRDLSLLFRRVDDEFIVDAADAHTGNRSHKRDIGNGQRARSTEHGRELRLVVRLDGKDRGDNLYVVAEALREQRANRAVNQTGTQHGLARRTAFALDEAARNLAGRIHLLLIIDRQREKVNAIARLSRGRGRHEHDRIAVTYEHGAIRLLGHLAVFDDERTASEFHLKAIHMYLLESFFSYI